MIHMQLRMYDSQNVHVSALILALSKRIYMLFGVIHMHAGGGQSESVVR